MRHVLTAVFVFLGVAAGIAAAAAIALLPEAVANMSHEREDAYLTALWGVVAAGFSMFWLCAAAHRAAGHPNPFSQSLRVTAKLVIGLGVVFALMAPFAELDVVLVALLSAACLLTGVAVNRSLSRRGESTNGA